MSSTDLPHHVLCILINEGAHVSDEAFGHFSDLGLSLLLNERLCRFRLLQQIRQRVFHAPTAVLGLQLDLIGVAPQSLLRNKRPDMSQGRQ